MLCKIADLIVNVPAAGGLASRCGEYLWTETADADIMIHEDRYRRDKYDPRVGENMVAYMESAYQFYCELIRFDGFYLHASAVVRNGKAYLFSGHCRAGKSTHARLWQQTFGGEVYVINDDKPALRCIDGIWYAYGTPWCGKDGINRNDAAPVVGVCFLKQASENRIRKLKPAEALQKMLSQTIYKFEDAVQLDLMLGHMERFLQSIPVYELENRPEPSAALMSYQTMSGEAGENCV